MRKKFLFCDCKIPMNLQLFAEGGDGARADDDNGDGSGGGAAGEGDEGGAGDQLPAFDDYLKSEGNMACM